MIIKSLTLCNFKNFYGENIIKLTPNIKNGKNIILIGGINGAGKTAILEAFKICLFGRKFNGGIASNRNYQKFLISAKNRRSNKKCDLLFFIKAEIDLNNSFPHYSLEIKREWFIKDDQVGEKFQIFRDGNLLEIIPQDYWQDYIISIVPLYVVDYFFFDGERIKELAVGDNAEKLLRKAIKDLIGLNLFKNLEVDLTNLNKKIRRRNIKNLDLKKEIEGKEKKVKESNKKVRDIISKVKKNEIIIEELSSKNIEIEENLKRKAGIYASDREKIHDSLLKLKEQLNYIDNEVRKICSEVLPFIMSSKLCKALLIQLDKEKKLKELIASRNILNNIKYSLLKKVNKSKKIGNIDEGNASLIKNEIDGIFSNMLIKIKRNHKDRLLHNLTSSESNSIENYLKNTEKDLSKKLKNILRKREEILVRIKQENKKLEQVPVEEFVDDYVNEITATKTEIEILNEENNRLVNGKKILDEEIRKIEENINILEEKAVCAEKDNIKIKISSKIQKVIKEFSDNMVRSKINYLEKLITNMYRKLANKNDMVKEIKIDKKIFTAQLLDYDRNIINKDSISSGEKEIYAISILWGLSKISNKKLPLIIDSPLAKLDSKHRANIIKDFFLNAADQVIILSHDEEISHNSYMKLKPNISSSYTLTFDEENKIIHGYFPKGKDGK